MAKRNLYSDFEIEFGILEDGHKEVFTFNGTFTDLLPKQIKEFNKKYKDSEQEDDSMFKERLELSVYGEDKKKILKFAEKYGYLVVLNLIVKDVTDKKEGN